MVSKVKIFFVLMLSLFVKTYSQTNIVHIKDLENRYYTNFSLQEKKLSNNYISSDSVEKEILFDYETLPEKKIESSVFVFRTFFTIDPKIENQKLSMLLGPVNYPCRIFLNKKMIYYVGNIDDFTTTKVQYTSSIFLLSDLINNDSVNEICIQAYTKKGDAVTLGKVFISSSENVENYTYIRNLIRQDIVKASIVFCFILALYFIFGYIQKKDKSDLKYIYFAFFCLTFAVSYANIIFSLNYFSDIIVYKTTRMALPLAVLTLVIYTNEFTQIIKRKKIVYLILTIIIFIVELLFVVQTTLAGIEKVFSIYVPTVNLPFNIFALILVIISTIKKKRITDVVFLLGFFVLFVGIFHDSYYFSKNIIPYAWYVPHGFLFLIITMFFILSSEQTKIFHLSIFRGQALQKMKDNLEIMVEQRTEKINQQNEELLLQSESMREVNTQLEEINAEVLQQKEELQAQTDSLQDAYIEITNQKEIIEKIHEDTTASITYAKRIQNGLLPTSQQFSELFSEFFIIYLPRDIVSGDFYFLRKVNNFVIIVTGDCTGHGVPGAFMSLLGIAFLNDIVTKQEIIKASNILEELRSHIKYALKQTGSKEEQKDGMDLALCTFDTQNNILQYSGANNPVIIVQNNKIIELKPVRNPIGIYIKEREFENYSLSINNNEILYMFTDGVVDQFGGESGRKYRIGRFKELLLEIHQNNLSEQRDLILNDFYKWKSNFKQIDDITVLGIKF